MKKLCNELETNIANCISHTHRFVTLQSHYSSYEPTLRQLKTKYETAMKEKMLSKLEKDRALGQVTGLQNTLKNIDALKV